MNELTQKIIIGIASAVGISLVSFLAAQFWKIVKEQKSIKKGLKALLRDRIIQMYNYYSKEKCIPIYARENVESLHSEYKNLGGNGTVDGLERRLMNMPTDHPENPDIENRDVID